MKTTLPEDFTRVGLRKYLACFTLMVALLLSTGAAAQVTSGKSYINITRPNGGTFAPGDIIEVRATIAVSGGSSGTPAATQIRYNDTINLNKFDYIPGSLKLISNEGRTQAAYTDANNDDRAMINTATPGLAFIRFTIGNGANASRFADGNGTTNTGNLWGAVFPTFFGGTCIQVFAYQIRIKNTPTIVDYDTTLKLYAGNFRYRISSGNQLSNFPVYTIKVFQDYGLCSNAIGGNALISESGGTFGSGRPKNRIGGSALVPLPYTFKLFAANAPNDNFYGLANNTSANWTTNPNVPYNDARRVFNIWEITGDHTGAADPIAGNPPADTTIASTNAGYALIINASYETNKAFEQTITNLCEDTYYEFSAWFKNMCRRCGCDSSGKGTGSAGYVPAPGNDSSGVRPNLTFQIDDLDYYTTGNIPFTRQWVKKGFIYRTKPGQTSFKITIRNNAPGGGGNDWAIDDIGVATCSPNMKYSPSLSPNVCNNNAFTIYDTVRSYFDNYRYYKWQKSTDGGTNWIDVGAPFGPVAPTWNAVAGAWEYVSSYTVPPTETFPTNSGDKYRLIVATSMPNLSNLNCRTTDNTNVVTLNVLICGPILSVDLTAFNGKIENSKASLRWTTTEEEEQIYFDVEKSMDATHFTTIATVNGNNMRDFNHYSFTDPDDLTGKTYYRIKMRAASGRIIYSRVLQLSGETKGFSFVSVINPFNHILYFDLSSARTGVVKAELLDQYGNPVRKRTFEIREGNNQFSFDNTSSLSSGVYILKAEMNGVVIYRKVLKHNN